MNRQRYEAFAGAALRATSRGPRSQYFGPVLPGPSKILPIPPSYRSGGLAAGGGPLVGPGGRTLPPAPEGSPSPGSAGTGYFAHGVWIDKSGGNRDVHPYTGDDNYDPDVNQGVAPGGSQKIGGFFGPN